MSAFCPHFGICGGCKTQNLGYPEQLELKRKMLAELFAPLYPGEITVEPSPRVQFYRNKMEFSFLRQVAAKNADGSLVFEQAFGLKAAGRWDRAVNLERCDIFSPGAGTLLQSARRWAAESGEEFYDARKRTGSLRQLLVREGKNSGGFMAVLFSAKPLRDEAGFVRAVREAYPAACVLWGLNDGVADVAAAKELKLLAGEGFLREEIDAGKLLAARISPRSFFQTNTDAAAMLYRLARDIAWQARPPAVYDVYGGAGLFSLACRDFCGKCVCVELSPDSVADGRANAELNGADIAFIESAAEDFLQAPPADFAQSLCVIDPPRAGLHPKAAQGLLESRPARLLYVSCNPRALERDLKILAPRYKTEFIRAFDLFPHTEHVETAALLLPA